MIPFYFLDCKEQVPFTNSGSSSILKGNTDFYGPNTIFDHSTSRYWHSDHNDNNPWISLRMRSSNVISIEVTDRQDNHKDCCYDRYKDVEVSVSYSSNINERNGKTSCGMKSHTKGGSTTYR